MFFVSQRRSKNTVKLRFLRVQELNLQNKGWGTQGIDCYVNVVEVPFSFNRQWMYHYPKYVLFDCDGTKHFIRVQRYGSKCFFADGLKDFRRVHNVNESVMVRFIASDKNTTLRVAVMGPIHRQILLAAASRFVYGFKKYITLQQGLGKCTQWHVMIHDDVPSIANPWFRYLGEKKLMVGDEVVFYFRFEKHAWELLIRKEIEWEEEDLQLED
ncbi:hypothetical protein GmHk_15G044999 [Glycine max]|nr:hypothetical protein GmHk_15G044999 [Glycine max]